jgi:hypothetical protein
VRQTFVGWSPIFASIVAPEKPFVRCDQNDIAVVGLDFNVADDGITWQLPAINSLPS